MWQARRFAIGPLTVAALLVGLSTNALGADAGYLVAHSQRQGMEVYALPGEAAWCREGLDLVVQLAPDSALLRTGLEVAIGHLGTVLQQKCPQAATAKLTVVRRDESQRPLDEFTVRRAMGWAAERSGTALATTVAGEDLSPSGTPALSATDACNPQQPHFELKRGETRCGFGLTSDGRLTVGKQVSPDAFVAPDGRGGQVAATGARLFSNDSPGGQYRVVWAIAHERDSAAWAGSAVYLFDTRALRLTRISLGEPPADRWYWSADGSHLAYLYNDEGWYFVEVVSADGGQGKRVEFSRGSEKQVPVTQGSGPVIEWRSGDTFHLRMGVCGDAACEEHRDVHYAPFRVTTDAVAAVRADVPANAPVGPSAVRSQVPTAGVDQLELKDGSVLIGTILDGKAPFDSALGVMQANLGEVLGFAEATLRLSDGSVLKGHFGDGTIVMATGRGELAVPARDIERIARGGSGPGTAVPAAAAGRDAGKGLLVGQITDNFGKPLAGVRVGIRGSALWAETDREGRYQLAYVPGEFRVVVSRDGYDRVDFDLKLTATSTYPVEPKGLVKVPPRAGVYFWGDADWLPLGSCVVLQVEKDSRDFEKGGTNRYVARGTPLVIATDNMPVFIDAMGGKRSLALYRVEVDGTIIRAKRAGGFGGLLGELEGRGSGTAPVETVKLAIGSSQRPGYTGPLRAGIYAFVASPAPAAGGDCYLFELRQVGAAGGSSVPSQLPPAQAEGMGVPRPPDGAAGRTLEADGNRVTYWPSTQGAQFAEFQFDTKGFRNTYLLDCKTRQFLWIGNVDIAVGRESGNRTGVEWRTMSAGSRIANAVNEAVCGGLLAKASEEGWRGNHGGGDEFFPVSQFGPALDRARCADDCEISYKAGDEFDPGTAHVRRVTVDDRRSPAYVVALKGGSAGAPTALFVKPDSGWKKLHEEPLVASLEVLPTRTNGFADLRMTSASYAGGVKRWVEETLRWDGGRYRWSDGLVH